MVRSDRVRRKGHELKHRLFPVKIRKTFILIRMIEQCHRLPREVVEIFKSLLAMVLHSRWHCLSRIGGPDDLLKIFPSSSTLILGFLQDDQLQWHSLICLSPMNPQVTSYLWVGCSTLFAAYLGTVLFLSLQHKTV